MKTNISFSAIGFTRFTESDWTELYYALDYDPNGDTELKKKIGPDGENGPLEDFTDSEAESATRSLEEKLTSPAVVGDKEWQSQLQQMIQALTNENT